MEDEKFQQLVLDKLDELTNGQTRLETEVSGIDCRMDRIVESVTHIQEQTAGLLEFRTEMKAVLENLAETQVAISAILGDHEVQIRKITKRIV